MFNIGDIKSDFQNRRINKKEAIKLLISTIESLEEVDFGQSESEILNLWDAIDTQVEAIKTFRKFNLKNADVYNILENLIVSEIDLQIKLIAIKEVVELFPSKSKKLLKWFFENDLWFKNIDKNLELDNWQIPAIMCNFFLWSNNEYFREIREKIEKRINPMVQLYVSEGVDPLEAKILTIFELQFGYKLIKIVNDNIKRYEEHYHYKLNKEGYITYIFINFKNPNAIIPERIDLLKNLDNLILMGGDIRVIPKSIQKLEKLKSLDLSFNCIKEIPDTLSFPESLENLVLTGNRLKAIPNSILKLRNLKVLELSSNEIEILPDAIKNAKNLVKLGLSRNKTNKIP